MVISSSTILSDSTVFVRDLLLAKISDPLASRPGNSKFVVTSFPSRKAVYPLITIQATEENTADRFVGTETQFVNIVLEVRVWARNVKEKNTIGDSVYNILRTYQLGTDGTVPYEMYNFRFGMVGDVDEPGKGNPKSRMFKVSYLVVAAS